MNKKNEPTVKPSRTVGKYFAALNTGGGFVSHFGEIFGRCDSIYIIKGGPGCGKSTFIRRAADEAIRRGDEVELFFCSSDTSSLDGAIFGGGRFALVDGTSPHILEPRNAGAVDSIVDLGAFWDADNLRKHSSEIGKLSEEIKNLYSSAYNYMKLMTVADTIAFEAVKKYIRYEKMSAAVGRLAGRFDPDGEEVRIRNTSAFGVNGYVYLRSFEERSDECAVFRDRFGIAHVFLDMLSDELSKKRIGYDISFSPVDFRRSALMIGNARYSFVSRPVCPSCPAVDENRVDSENVKNLNTERFLDKKVSEARKTVEDMRYVRASASGSAEKILSRVGVLHGELENIYIGSMDHGSLDRFTRNFINKLFGL